MTTGWAAAEKAARNSYGRLLAWLTWQWRDIAAAEDALAEAFATALQRWPADGIPTHPDAWLLRVAQRCLLMDARRQRLASDPAVTALLAHDGKLGSVTAIVPDHRLRLMFVCTHPAIDPAIRSALILQVVLGLNAQTIASAFLVKPEAMTKRLVRAKTKILASGIRFTEPDASEWPQRLSDVLEAIYGTYTCRWNQKDRETFGQLAEEAMFLTELVSALLPQEPEALGLLALLSLCEARRPAQFDALGRFTPLEEQDVCQWNEWLITRADECLAIAASFRRPGPYQLEAAIQAAYVEGRRVGSVPWEAIMRLHEHLLALAPTTGGRIAHAVAVAYALTPEQGLRLLDQIDSRGLVDHQPWWAARAHVLAMAGHHEFAARAYEKAAALSVDPALRVWLINCREKHFGKGNR